MFVMCVAHLMYPEPEHDPIHKTKRNRHETECAVKRQRDGCGICGSLNIVSQGVTWCTECGAEIDWIITIPENYSDREDQRPCNCIKIYQFRNRVHQSRPWREISVGKCLDCGAVRSAFCPNCRNSRRCWKHWDGRIYCQRCGYRIEERKKVRL